MKIKRYKGSDARRILVAMVTDQTVCARIASKWMPEGLFSSRWENLVGGWCVRYFNKYGKPIGRAIEPRFQRWADSGKDDSTIDLLDRFLVHLNDEYEKNGDGFASDFVLDLAGKHFNKVRLKQAVEEVEIHLDENDVETAQQKWSSLNKVDLGIGSIFQPGEDLEGWVDAFDKREEDVLIKYPGDLGKFIGNDLCRDGFVSFMGSTGIGKSWWLLDMGFRGVRSRKKVAYFECGDMSKKQVTRRMGQRASLRPKYSGSYPKPIGFDDEDKPIIETVELKAATARDSLRAWNKAQYGQNLFRLSCHPNSSINAEGIGSILTDWAREEWVADIVVIDYADILAPPAGKIDDRDGINATWKYLRRLSQEFHCLVVTATQADAASYEKALISKSNFSNDRRKNDHVTGMIGLNVTVGEKDLGVSRLNWLKRRDEYFNEKKYVRVAGMLSTGRPVVKSVY